MNDELRSLETPEKFFSEWAYAHSVTPSILSEQTGFSYQHCWGLLSGSKKITLCTLSVLLVTFGEAGPAIELAKTMRPQWLQKRLRKMEIGE